MKKPVLSLVSILFAAPLLAACGSSSSDDGASGTGASGRSSEPTVKVVASGFGQADGYAQGIAIVSSGDESAIGESVTVSMNFLNAGGDVIGTQEQVEAFRWEGQKLVLPVFFDLSEGGNSKAQVASVDASASISNYGSSDQPKQPLKAVDSDSVKRGEYGGFTASFTLTNDSDKPLSDPRIGIVCYGQGNKIIGGTAEYPSLIAAGKSIKLTTNNLIVSRKPSKCTAYPSYDVV